MLVYARHCVLLLSLLLLPGCFQPTLELSPPTAEQIYASQLGAARAAWTQNNSQAIEQYYGMVAANSLATGHEKAEAWERMALAAAQNQRAYRGLAALDQWRMSTANADMSAQWQNAWNTIIRLLSPRDQFRQASSVLRDPSRPASLRAQAALIVVTRQEEGPPAPAAMELLDSVYISMDSGSRAALERSLMAELQHTSDWTLARAVTGVFPEQDQRFPYNVFILALARRYEKQPDAATGGNASELLGRIALGNFADPVLAGRSVESAPQPTNAPVAVGGCVVLTLPLSGHFSPVGWKVARGASAAQQELAGQNITLDVRFVDTANTDWLEQLAALPQECVAVGGPLQTQNFEHIRNATGTATGIAANPAKKSAAGVGRVFFTFLPGLEQGEEGRSAWRFFSSPEDQIRALLRFTQDYLGITSYGVLTPNDSYGQKMTELFSADVRKTSGQVTVTEYPLEDTRSWNKIAREFVGAREVGDIPVPSSSFQAVFLPDTWKNMDLLVTGLFYHGEDKQVLLGTSLWEQGLSESRHVDTRHFQLAVFPGAWNRSLLPAAAELLNASLQNAGQEGADFWVGLGYDFVRFAAAMGLKDPLWTAVDVNARIQNAQNIQWSMAPLHWTPQGQASQEMFLFTPSPEGFVSLDPLALRQAMERATARQASRVRGAASGSGAGQ